MDLACYERISPAHIPLKRAASIFVLSSNRLRARKLLKTIPVPLSCTKCYRGYNSEINANNSVYVAYLYTLIPCKHLLCLDCVQEHHWAREQWQQQQQQQEHSKSVEVLLSSWHTFAIKASNRNCYTCDTLVSSIELCDKTLRSNSELNTPFVRHSLTDLKTVIHVKENTVSPVFCSSLSISNNTFVTKHLSFSLSEAVQADVGHFLLTHNTTKITNSEQNL